MADEPIIRVKITGIEELEKDLKRFGPLLFEAIEAAGKEAGQEILDTVGLQHYPPAGPGNRPPYPYYERGYGTHTGPGTGKQTSEVLGKQFYVSSNRFTATIGNRASYAAYVVGMKQRRNMARIGWRKLFEVAEEKLDAITKIYQGWINRALKKSGLKS